MDGYSGDAGDAIRDQPRGKQVSNGRMFTTVDSDNDIKPHANCAVTQFGAGWWHASCSRCELNADGNAQWAFDATEDVQASRMLLKLD